MYLQVSVTEPNEKITRVLEREYARTRRHLINSCIQLVDEYKFHNETAFIDGEHYHTQEQLETKLLAELHKRNPYAKKIAIDELLLSSQPTLHDTQLLTAPSLLESLSILTGANTKYEYQLSLDVMSLNDVQSPIKQSAVESLHKDSYIKQAHILRNILRKQAAKEKRDRCASLCETGIARSKLSYDTRSGQFVQRTDIDPESNQQLIYEITGLQYITSKGKQEEMAKSLDERSTVLLELIKDHNGVYPTPYGLEDISWSTEDIIYQYGASADTWKRRVYSLKNRFPLTNATVTLQIELLSAEHSTNIELQYIRGNITDATKRQEWRGFYATVDALRQSIPSLHHMSSSVTCIVIVACFILFILRGFRQKTKHYRK